MKSSSTSDIIFLVVAGIALTACQSSHYTSSISLTSSLSMKGADDQHDLSERVVATVSTHKLGLAAFDSAYTLIMKFTKSQVEVDQDLYNELLVRVDQCAFQCDRIASSNARLAAEAADLFTSWATDLEQFSSPQLRKRSAARMQNVQARYDSLASRLRGTRARMDSALVGLQDYVLFFNHNLNARSASSIDFENESLAQEIRALRAEVVGTRSHGNDFIAALHGGTAPTFESY